MSQLKIRFRGNPVPSASTDFASSDFEMVQTYQLLPASRGEVPEVNPDPIEDDDLIQLSLSDDTLWIGDHTTLRALFPDQSLRSGDAEVLYLDDLVDETSSDRGLKKISINFLSVFKKKKKSVKGEVRKLAIDLENKQLETDGISFKEVGAGLLTHCSEDFKLSKKESLPIGSRALLFLHGTGSSTSGSFQELYGKSGNLTWKSIYQSYGSGNVLAFQHRTLSHSPLQNVLELVKQLPDEIELDVVTHSRGGLVGDVLARFATDSRGFDAAERGVLAIEKRSEDLEAIDAIESVLKQKKISVRNMVRVASPANGTTLASGRMDQFLNVLLNLFGLLVGSKLNPVFQLFQKLVMEAVASKDNPEILPGLEAMNPASPFIKVLNFQGSEIKVDSLLHVVGGSSENSLSLRGLVVLLGKFFFRGENDLVVDTESMKWGAIRKEGKTSIFIDSSKTINHIVYFSTTTTQERIFQGLQEKTAGTRGGFVPKVLRKSTDRGALGVEGGRTFQDRVSGKRPIVVLLPGIMGSNLTVNEDMVWINYARFLTGQLTRLKNDPKNNLHVQPHSLVKTSYGKLTEYLSKTYDVVTFPFDWRISLLESARILDSKLQELMRYNQPIKLLAHSMGGVLVRDFMVQHEDTWLALSQRSGFKALFLGSPLGGSYRIPYVLFGKDDIIKLLAKIDIANSLKELLQVFSRLPGLLNLLPLKLNPDDVDFGDYSTWEKMRVAFGDPNWPIPDPSLLLEFDAYQKKIADKFKSLDYSSIYYIAGQSRPEKVTISSMKISDVEGLEFFGTNEGDESVTWATGIPSQVVQRNQLYYANVTHGGLSNQTSLFGAIEDILSHGKCSLPNQLPKKRGGVAEQIRPKVQELFDLSEENFENVILGLGAEKPQSQDLPVQVTVVHGDLKFAKFPVLAGHFEQDAILTTEKVIDRHLNGELNRIKSLGLYPGKIGTNQIVLSGSASKFKGAIIVGLGTPGELSSFQLTVTVEKGVARYLTILNKKESDQERVPMEPVGISVLAIANSYGGLSSDTSIRAVLLGIQQANQKVKTSYKGTLRVIEEVEIIEVYQDKALSILKTVNLLRENFGTEYKFSLKNKGLEQKPGRKVRIPFEVSADWWTRIHVARQENQTDKRFPIKMTLATSGASQKQEFLKVNTANLDTLLLEMTEKNQARPEIAKTMFELLVPFDFKEELKRQPNISWVVDEETASFPWEMLQEDIEANPLSVNSGMVRQMATESYRKNPSRIQENIALVIGDPELGGFMPQLFQAEKEGRLVMDLLQKSGFEVTHSIRESPSEIMVDVFSKGYKIMHLAAHGTFDPKSQDASGVVIGPNSFLSVQEIALMSNVPELVFVNCCYLGKTERESGNSGNQKNKLAANIGTQLIRNGVKAVVVAGWAVDDQAALEFAEEFYREMLSGQKFGEAVRNARRKIFNAYRSHTNTWGAYQCYGDPFYQLSSGENGVHQVEEFLVKEEVEIELINLNQQLDSQAMEDDRVLEILEKLEKDLKVNGIQSGKITECFAVLFAKVGLYDRAVPYFEQLFQTEKAGFSFKALELWCNISCKHAIEVYEAGNKTEEDRKKTLDAIDQAAKRLQSLNEFGVTAERMSLLGSAYKRKLLLLKNEAVQFDKSLKDAVASYQKASEMMHHQDNYPLVNWVQLAKMHSLRNSKAKLKAEAEIMSLILACKQEEVKKRDQQNDPWSFFGLANLALTELVLDEGKTPNLGSEVEESFLGIFERVGSKGHLKAQLEHLTILIEALESVNQDGAKKLHTQLDQLRERLKPLDF